MKFTQAIATKLVDWITAERWRLNVDQRIGELQRLPIAGATVIQGISLPNVTDVFVRHGLGREPRIVLLSPPYPSVNTNGAIAEWRGTSFDAGVPIDRTQVIVLRAGGWGVTITVDVTVM